MRKYIRRNVFETNSSSVHSLVISKEGLEPSDLEIDENGYINVDFGNFGSEEHLYTSQYDKLQYLITCLYYTSGYDPDSIAESYDFEEIQEAICGYTGAKGINILGKNEPYIDHQSVPYGSIEIVNIYDKEAIVNFVFNRFISLKTDCD